MKKRGKLKLKVIEGTTFLNDSEMKNVVGGWGEPIDGGTLPDVTIWGDGPNYCTSEWVFNLPVQCDKDMSWRGVPCRTADCKQIGQCGIVPISLVPSCLVGKSGQVIQ